mmetsp:Transcript_11829/g.17732  ORF Transcript_11829/g.17732 Transcript_11829/m.17732 type:complete len:302 (-) Transcript_11829:1872-2777(-)
MFYNFFSSILYIFELKNYIQAHRTQMPFSGSWREVFKKLIDVSNTLIIPIVVPRRIICWPTFTICRSFELKFCPKSPLLLKRSKSRGERRNPDFDLSYLCNLSTRSPAPSLSATYSSLVIKRSTSPFVKASCPRKISPLVTLLKFSAITFPLLFATILRNASWTFSRFFCTMAILSSVTLLVCVRGTLASPAFKSNGFTPYFSSTSWILIVSIRTPMLPTTENGAASSWPSLAWHAIMYPPLAAILSTQTVKVRSFLIDPASLRRLSWSAPRPKSWTTPPGLSMRTTTSSESPISSLNFVS